MNERFMDMLKKYLKKNERKAIGYSEEEITKIEKLYDIEAKGDFREFLKYAGRCDGDLLGDDPIILYRQTWDMGSYLRKNVSIPSWLNEMAKKSNINFSNILQEALKHELGID